MAQHIKLNPDSLHALRAIDPRLMSYNVEMTEITGGTFWKACIIREMLAKLNALRVLAGQPEI